MVRKNWIPRSDIDFDGFFGRYTAAAVKNTSGTPPVWPHIPPDRAMALNSACVAWHAARAKLNGPHTSGDVLAKNGLRAECETVAKPRCGFASGVCSANSTLGYKGTASPPPKGSQTATRFESGRSPTPSASQNCFAVLLLEFAQAQTPEVNPRSGFTTTTRPAPASTPPGHWPGLRAAGGYAVELRFQDEAAPDSTAISYGMNGCLLNYVWGPEKIGDRALLKEAVLMTRSPYVLSLPPQAEGAFLSCCARWQNKTGRLGKPGDIRHIAVS